MAQAHCASCMQPVVLEHALPCSDCKGLLHYECAVIKDVMYRKRTDSEEKAWISFKCRIKNYNNASMPVDGGAPKTVEDIILQLEEVKSSQVFLRQQNKDILGQVNDIAILKKENEDLKNTVLMQKVIVEDLSNRLASIEESQCYEMGKCNSQHSLCSVEDNTKRERATKVRKKDVDIIHRILDGCKEARQVADEIIFLGDKERFRKLEQRMYELMKYRSEILSGTLPVDELRKKEHLLATTIDLGNHLLELDMVVRDLNCNIPNPKSTSTVQLFWQHQNAMEDIKKSKNDAKPLQKTTYSSNQFCYSLFLTVSQFICKNIDEAELLFSLYDPKENVPFTENYVIKWTQGFHPFPLKALFTDLGSKEKAKGKVYLICYVIRLATSVSTEVEKDSTIRVSRIHKKTEASSNAGSIVRRPFGLAIFDCTDIFQKECNSLNDDDQHCMPFIPCEKEPLEQTLKKALTSRDGFSKEQGIWVTLKLLHGDLKQVREENPHLVVGNVSISRKMGFPEVILPGDVRNDLYLTLVSGEFLKGSRSNEKNIQITVTVLNKEGVIPNVISLGGGADGVSEFKSVVYYHEGKPKWNEIFKIVVPIEAFKDAHVKFTFKHRSSNESKDKAEKPFALCYAKLMQDNGTILRDTNHNLCVYRIEPKKYDENDLGYLNLPSFREENKAEKKEEKCPGLIFSPKDVFTISTNVCSTKLTQNVDLLGLLNWADNKDSLQNILTEFMSVDGEEVVKYLQDVLDALFSILMQNSDCDLYDDIVFKCLIFIIGLVSDRKYQHFEPVLDVYIKESFSATLAYGKMMAVLKSYIASAEEREDERDFQLKLMKSLQYIFKFIVRSRVLFSNLNGGKGQEQFEYQLKDLLKSFVDFMKSDSPSLLLVYGGCLKHLPSAIPDIMTVFKPSELSTIIAELIEGNGSNRFVKQKMMSINEIVKGPLFCIQEAREILLPFILKSLKTLLEPQKEELCVKVLSDIMELLFSSEVGATDADISEVMFTILRTVIQSTIDSERGRNEQAPMVVIMLSIFRQMTYEHFIVYVQHFQTNEDRKDFLNEILMVFTNLISNSVFPLDWCEMLMLQNSIILKSLRIFSETINDYFLRPFDHETWKHFFDCAITFVTQASLRVETFSLSKRIRILTRYGDMRRDMSDTIRRMWYNLGQYKIRFVPDLVENMLKMTLIPDRRLRNDNITIFFDMMQCEFYSSKSGGFTKRDSLSIKGDFSKFENEMIKKLDVLFGEGMGDEDYKNIFYDQMLNACEHHSALHSLGVKFVKTVSLLMERLLEYRLIIVDENKDNRMSCVVNLLNFYREINRNEMYIKYVNKLCDLHLDSGNYTEAAFTLKLHSDLLSWKEEPLSEHLRSLRHMDCHYHVELKEAIYRDCINYFDKGKMWECAIKLCKELIVQYEEYIHDYSQLSEVLDLMSRFYRNIKSMKRFGIEYFRVAFYGRGFPAYLQNTEFVYRGKECDKLHEMNDRMLSRFPNAEVLTKLDTPGPEITEAPVQYLQINKVEPIMEKIKAEKVNKAPDIFYYYRTNEVRHFQYSRRSNVVADSDVGNIWLERINLTTSYSLPGILMWFPVKESQSSKISPIQTAIETITSKMDSLLDLLNGIVDDDYSDIKPLTMMIKGIVEPDVNGGIANYERFCSGEYELLHPSDSENVQLLKRRIGEQIPLLEKAIEIHDARVSQDLRPLHDHLAEVFAKMRATIHEKYGVFDNSTLKLRKKNRIRRQLSTISSGLFSPYSDRNSATSLSPSESTTSGSALMSIFDMKSRRVPSSANTTLRLKEKSKEKRKSKLGSSYQVSQTPKSQWYTGAEVTPVSNGTQRIFELRQELQPARPLRSEVEREKRLSRPGSGHFRLTSSDPSLRSPHVPGNRDSTGTTESNTSEEDQIPPPLPAKQRDSEYSKTHNEFMNIL